MYELLKGTFITLLNVGEKTQRLDGTNLDTGYTMPQYEHNDTSNIKNLGYVTLGYFN